MLFKYADINSLLRTAGAVAKDKMFTLAQRNLIKDIPRMNKLLWSVMANSKRFVGLPRMSSGKSMISALDPGDSSVFARVAIKRGADPHDYSTFFRNPYLKRRYDQLLQAGKNRLKRARGQELKFGHVFDRPPRVYSKTGYGNAGVNPLRNQILYDPQLMSPMTLAHQNAHVFDAAIRHYPIRSMLAHADSTTLKQQARASALALRNMKASGEFSPQQLRQAHEQALAALRTYQIDRLQTLQDRRRYFRGIRDSLPKLIKKHKADAWSWYYDAMQAYVNSLKDFGLPIPRNLK